MKALEKAASTLARLSALAGGIVLLIVVAVTVISVTGRAVVTLANAHDAQAWYAIALPAMQAIGTFLSGIGLKPIQGDYELVEAGTAFAIFSFLPWCQLQRGNATVELLTPMFSTVANKLLDLVGDLLMLAVAVLILWRHWLGTFDKASNAETTFILQFPVWWPYAACIAGAAIFCLICVYCVMRSALALAGNGPRIEGGAVH